MVKKGDKMEYTKKWLDKNRIAYTISADGLVYVDGYIKIPEKTSVTLEYLADVSGSVYVSENATFTAPALVKSGYVDVRANATFTAPALVKSGSVYVSENATFTAPALVKSGSVYVSENATFTAPALVTIEEVKYTSEWFGHSVNVYDGMGCVTVSEKTRDDITIRYCRKAAFKDAVLIGKKYFVVSRGEHNSHGETLEAAMADLMFKT